MTLGGVILKLAQVPTSSCLRVRFFCYRDLRFCQNDAATATVQIKEEEKSREKSRKGEQKRRGTALTKVVFANE